MSENPSTYIVLTMGNGNGYPGQKLQILISLQCNYSRIKYKLENEHVGTYLSDQRDYLSISFLIIVRVGIFFIFMTEGCYKFKILEL